MLSWICFIYISNNSDANYNLNVRKSSVKYVMWYSSIGWHIIYHYLQPMWCLSKFPSSPPRNDAVTYPCHVCWEIISDMMGLCKTIWASQCCNAVLLYWRSHESSDEASPIFPAGSWTWDRNGIIMFNPVCWASRKWDLLTFSKLHNLHFIEFIEYMCEHGRQNIINIIW